MSEQQFQFNFGNHKGYTTYDGDGAAALLDFDGFFAVQLKRFKLQMTKSEPAKPMAKLTLKLHPSEKLGAQTIYAQALIDGEDKNGDNMGRQFLDVLVSFGLFTEEQAQQKADRGEAADPDALLSAVIAQELTGYVEVQADTYQNKTSSKVNNFVTKAIYEREVNGGTARRPRSGGAGAAPAGNGPGKAASGMLKDIL